MQHLNVSGCHQISDAGIIAIAQGCPELNYLDVSVLQVIPHLKCEYLSSWFFDFYALRKRKYYALDWQNLGDLALVELGEGCPLLKDIVLSHCRQLTDVGLAHLVRNCTMLESCHMVYCQGITQSGVASVVSSCPNIKKVMVEKWKVSARTKRRAGSVITYLCVDL